MNEGRIVRVERQGVSSDPGRTDWKRLEAMTDEERHQNALEDPDNPPWSEKMLARARRVPNVRAIRTRLGMTQEEFARVYEISLHSIRDWEQGRSRPDYTARTLLRLIDRRPDMVREALAS